VSEIWPDKQTQKSPAGYQPNTGLSINDLEVSITMNELHRKARIMKLRLNVWLRWLAVELEPAGSQDFRQIASRYAAAKGELNRALLKEREEGQA